MEVTRGFYRDWDESGYRKYMELFKTLKEHGVTIFFSTHITSDLERCADDIVYISGIQDKQHIYHD